MSYQFNNSYLLQEVFKFSSEDLFENKNGRLSNSQKIKLLKNLFYKLRWYLLMFFIIVGYYAFVFGLGASGLNQFISNIKKSLPAVIVLSLIFIFIILREVYKYKNYNIKHDSGLIKIEKLYFKDVSSGKNRALYNMFADNSRPFYKLSLGKFEYYTGNEKEMSIFNKDKSYTIHYLKGNMGNANILSVEIN